MNWRDELAVAEELETVRARGRLLRGVVIWGPVFAIVAGAFVFFFFDRLFLGGDNGGTWFFVGFLALLAFLFGFQASQPLLDLRSGPREAIGMVSRSWSRSDSLVMRSHYIRLDRGQILRVGAEFHADVKEGDRLRVTFYPHSAVAIWVEKLPLAGPADASDGLA